MHFFGLARGLYLWEGLDLFGIGLDSPLVDDVPQKPSLINAECVFVRIQFHFVSSEKNEHLLQVVDMVSGFEAFYKHIIHVHLHGFLHELGEHTVDFVAYSPWLVTKVVLI